ncbi:MAG: DUF4376 domain-containing protein [Sporomusaceae bacterium]|jgi:hypothetical protein|nr:DUF4376 domain-containing protein [Sporomusaceae bacterium]
MKLIYRKPQEEFGEFLDVELVDNYILNLQLFKHGFDENELIDAIELNLQELFVPYTRFKICFTRKNKFSSVINYDEIQSSRDTYNTLSIFYDLHSDKSFTLFFGETPDDILLLTSAYINREEAEHIPITTFASEIICQHFPEYEEKLAPRNARREMLLELDPNDSLSYLESQVDILSEIILEMVKTNPSIKKSCPAFDKFEATFTATNLFNVKSMDKCLGEISETKSKVRKLQDKYYQATKSNYQSKPPPTLQEIRNKKRQKINAIRNAKEQGVFYFAGKPFDSDSVSAQRIAVAAQNALVAKIVGAEFAIEWTLADNSTITLNADEMLAVSQALAVHAATVHTTAKNLKDVINAAATQEEVENISWPEV